MTPIWLYLLQRRRALSTHRFIGRRRRPVRGKSSHARRVLKIHHHRHHFTCPIIQQYAHLHRYNFRRAGQQGPTRTLTAALNWGSKLGLVVTAGLNDVFDVFSTFLRPRGRPKRTWREVVREDCQARKLNKEDAMDRSEWRKMIKNV